MATVEELMGLVEGLTEYERKTFLTWVLDRYGIKSDPIPAPGLASPGDGSPLDYGQCAPAYGGPPSPPQDFWEPQYEFAVNLVEVGPNTINVIKTVRDLTNWGLKECKDFVDLARVRPQVFKENVSRADADEQRHKLEAVGARVTVT